MNTMLKLLEAKVLRPCAAQKLMNLFVSTATLTSVGCTSLPVIDGGSHAPNQVDPAIYLKHDDPKDPFRAKYAEFRARRTRDMASPDSPAALDRYPALHRTNEQPWGSLEELLPFDWEALRAESPVAVAQLEDSVRLRIAFDHPDLKISQLMIGAGGHLPGHADGSPGAFIVVAGRGEITVEGRTSRVSPGSTVKLAPYDVRRIDAFADTPLRLLWIRWAPGGDQAYIDAGYYLTGANQHVQPVQATMSWAHLFWGEVFVNEFLPAPTRTVVVAAERSSYASAEQSLRAARGELGEARDPYPGVEIFGHESQVDWLSAETLKGAGFFFSDDLGSMGPVADRMIEIARHKAIFRVTRPDGRWDFNFSESVWGPRSTYVEHSHVIPEFYYVMSGPVIYGVDGERHRVGPGDIIFNNSYSPHFAQGVVDGLAFHSFSSTFAPNGDRRVFERDYFLVEPLVAQPESAFLGPNPSFHPEGR